MTHGHTKKYCDVLKNIPQRRFDMHTDIARAAEKGDSAFTLPMLPAGESDAAVFAVVKGREKNADVKN